MLFNVPFVESVSFIPDFKSTIVNDLSKILWFLNPNVGFNKSLCISMGIFSVSVIYEESRISIVSTSKSDL